MFNCSLPWTSDKQHVICPIIDQNRNETYRDMIGIWTSEYEKTINTNTMPKCKRSQYKKIMGETKHWNDDTKVAFLKIKLENPNVLSIVDSYSYDIQSFVGEVGGTLGLFLGLSIFSFVEFAEYILRKMYSERPDRILDLC